MVGKYCKRKSDGKIQENFTHTVCAFSGSQKSDSIQSPLKYTAVKAASHHCRLLSLHEHTHTEAIENIIYSHKHLSCHSALEPHEQK